MRRSSPSLFRSPYVCLNGVHTPSRPPIVQIENATFYRHHPSSGPAGGQNAPANPPLFPGLTFSLPSFPSEPQHWCVLGPSGSGKVTFLEVLRGRHLCFPPGARSYPYLASDEIAAKNHRLRIPARAFQYVGFSGERGGLGGPGTRGAYLSARYESRREETDFSLLDYLKGHTELNPAEEEKGRDKIDGMLEKVIKDLRLEELIEMPVSNLSNGQTRRARIAKALLDQPEVLLLDEPFMGLDPPTLITLSPLLHRLAVANAPRLVLSLRPQDPMPEWITHLVYLDQECRVAHQGSKNDVLSRLNGKIGSAGVLAGENATKLPVKTPGMTRKRSEKVADGDAQREVLVKMEGVRVKYGDKTVLGNWTQGSEGKRSLMKHGLWWTVRRGDRWGIFGPNGSGKTTLLSLICSDHPQAYALPLELFGQSRLPKPGCRGISIFDIQARIGHSSPEIHAFFPRHLSVRQTLENAWAETFLGKAELNNNRDRDVDTCLRWFHAELNPRPEQTIIFPYGVEREGSLSLESGYEQVEGADLDWADELRFGELSFSAQRVALFLRAIIKKPDLVILDEAFSGMDSHVRDRCMRFLEHGQRSSGVKNLYTTNKTNPKTSHTFEKLGTLGTVETFNKLRFSGLSHDQALICVSHVKEEVPASVREWMCLPEANTGARPRSGRLRGPLQGNTKRWNIIWELN